MYPMTQAEISDSALGTINACRTQQELESFLCGIDYAQLEGKTVAAITVAAERKIASFIAAAEAAEAAVAESIDETAVAAVVLTAYNVGALQYSPLTVCGITVTMTMHARFNRLKLTYGKHRRETSLYDTDSEFATAHAIEEVIADLVSIARNH